MTLTEIKEKLELQRVKQQDPPVTYEQALVMRALKKTYSKKKPRSNSTLTCPDCGSDHMHHYNVELFHRPEDSSGDHITIFDPYSYAWDLMNCLVPDHTVDSNFTDNPSARRGGILISFLCEECHNIIQLGIAQHKGQTHMEWL